MSATTKPGDELEQAIIDKVYPEFAGEITYDGLNPMNQYRMNEIMHLIAEHERAARIDEIQMFRLAMLNHSTPMIYTPQRIAQLTAEASEGDVG